MSANSRHLEWGDFGKFGAFVQQDDLLLVTFTPEELLRFACQLKTSLSKPAIEERVAGILTRLRL